MTLLSQTWAGQGKHEQVYASRTYGLWIDVTFLSQTWAGQRKHEQVYAWRTYGISVSDRAVSQGYLYGQGALYIRMLSPSWKQVVKALRRDDVEFYDQILREGSAFLGPEEVKCLWSIVRRSLPKVQQRRMTTPPFQLEGLEDQWLPHSGELEAGTSTTLPELLQTCVSRQTRNLSDAPIGNFI